MDPETEVVAEVPAPETEATAAPTPEVETPVEPTPPKTFTQEELDAIVSKRLAREQRKWEREQRINQPVAAPTVVDVPPIDQFPTPEAYADALADKKAEEKLAQREAARQDAETLEQYNEREEEARGKYDDFEQVAYNPALKITAVMAQTIRASEVGPEVAYHLGTNPKEAERISRLAPFLQAKEIGRIEAKLVSDPPVKKTSSAPPPIAPVSPRSQSTPSFDTTDPRSVKSMSTSEWIAADRERQRKKWAAQNR
jgi:hypothetical protein